MAIIGFNFTKIAAQRLSARGGKIQINNNIGIQGVVSQKFGADDAREAVKVSFIFDCVYEPKVAHLQMQGDVTLLLEKKVAQDILKNWNEKKGASNLAGPMNHVLERCNVQAIMLARDLNLPSPVPLPKVSVKGVDTKVEKKDEKKTAPKKKSKK